MADKESNEWLRSIRPRPGAGAYPAHPIDLNEPDQAGKIEEANTDTLEHDQDYRWVKLGADEYTLTKTQAKVIKHLAGTWPNPDTEENINRRITGDSSSTGGYGWLRQLFKRSEHKKAFKALLVHKKGTSHYRLIRKPR
jgi:hypothetical protein